MRIGYFYILHENGRHSRTLVCWYGTWKVVLHFIDGRNSSDALPIIKEFSESSGFNFLVLNPKAAGVGLTLPQHHVIHYNPESARVCRIGQEKSVIVHWLFYSDTIESNGWTPWSKGRPIPEYNKRCTGEESSNIALLEYLRGEWFGTMVWKEKFTQMMSGKQAVTSRNSLEEIGSRIFVHVPTFRKKSEINYQVYWSRWPFLGLHNHPLQ